MPAGPRFATPEAARRAVTDRLKAHATHGPWTDRSCRSRALEPPPRMILTIAASQIAPAACSPHTVRAWARDCRTTMVEIPDPPPSDISDGSEGSG